MTALLDRARRLYALADHIVDRMGYSAFRVGVRSEASTEAFGVPDGVPSESVRWFAPTPRVRKIDTVEASSIGLSFASSESGMTTRDVYEVTLVRHATLTGADGVTRESGLKVSDLFPVEGSAQSRSTLILADARADGELGTEGQPFTIERITTDELTIVLWVVQAQPVR